MKITVKVRPRAGKTAASVVRARLAKARAKGNVEEVFPGETRGRRAGMLIVDVSDEASDRVLKELRDADEIEYADPAPRRSARRRA